MSEQEPAPRLTFRPHEHLRRPADFKRVYDRRRSVSNETLIVHACPNGLDHNRLSYVHNGIEETLTDARVSKARVVRELLV